MITRDELNQLFSSVEIATDREPRGFRHGKTYIRTADMCRSSPRARWNSYDNVEYKIGWKLKHNSDGTMSFEYVDLSRTADEELVAGDTKILDDFLSGFGRKLVVAE